MLKKAGREQAPPQQVESTVTQAKWQKQQAQVQQQRAKQRRQETPAEIAIREAATREGGLGGGPEGSPGSPGSPNHLQL